MDNYSLQERKLLKALKIKIKGLVKGAGSRVDRGLEKVGAPGSKKWKHKKQHPEEYPPDDNLPGNVVDHTELDPTMSRAVELMIEALNLRTGK